ncbi:uncharacterized protein LOC114544192 isoform X2 [Dendronephthya gigantea]|uniref:uncharacterized protein LOC114544192 isoform X2 n=1 Tax=Dendronephthya gigantea TaxID=151771 RepID=UPI00106D30E2|nr:uncharacterized protein LOC114544192 isoform X2 [Dendronephthya gigantea]
MCNKLAHLRCNHLNLCVLKVNSAWQVHVQQPANDGWKRKQLDVWSTSKAAGGVKAIYQWKFKTYMSSRNIRCLLESSKVLNSSYKNRNNVNYLTKMGIAIEF